LRYSRPEVRPTCRTMEYARNHLPEIVRRIGWRLAPSRCSQGCHEAVANQRIDVCDVRPGEPTGKADDGLELAKRRPAALASFEMLIDASALALVHLAVEVGGHQANELDALEVLHTRPTTVQGDPPSPRGSVPGVCERDRGRE
jgi:hypothetical protein